MSARRTPARGARTAAAVAVLLVLVLVAVLVGLVGTGSGGSDAVPAGGRTSVAPTSTRAGGPASTTSSRRPSAPATRSATGRDAESGLALVALRDLPREAQTTVALVDAGGPFPYAKDGVTFGNNERVLPAHPRGWYREYTVRTPGESDRGARRIVTGDRDTQIFYTADHYATFVRVTR